HRNGRAVRHEPPRLRRGRGGARNCSRSLSREAGAHLDTITAFARGRVHQSDVAGQGQFPMSAAERSSGFLRRTVAMLVKEFLHLKRDRVSFAMIIMIPLIQLMLFGYAINTNPRHLPTAVLLQEQSDLGRSILKALENTKYFEVTQVLHDEAEFDRVFA